MNCCDLAPDYVRAIAPYLPGKPISELAREFGLAEADIVKLASNENPLGPSPRALAAAQDALADMALYPDGAGFALKARLSQKFGVDAKQVVLGNGSNDVLDMVARAFLAPGTSSVFSQHAFAVYPIATQTVGAQGIAVPARAYGHDLAAMRAAIRDDTRVLWIANPNNPTGTAKNDADRLTRLVKDAMKAAKAGDAKAAKGMFAEIEKLIPVCQEAAKKPDRLTEEGRNEIEFTHQAANGGKGALREIIKAVAKAEKMAAEV